LSQFARRRRNGAVHYAGPSHQAVLGFEPVAGRQSRYHKSVIYAIFVDVLRSLISMRPVSATDRMIYVLPAGTSCVEIRSPSARAYETSDAEIIDGRRLGIALAAVTLTVGRVTSTLDLSAPSHEGLYPAAEGAVWTDGCARLNLAPLSAAGVLKFSVVTSVGRFIRARTDGVERLGPTAPAEHELRRHGDF